MQVILDLVSSSKGLAAEQTDAQQLAGIIEQRLATLKPTSNAVSLVWGIHPTHLLRVEENAQERQLDIPRDLASDLIASPTSAMLLSKLDAILT